MFFGVCVEGGCGSAACLTIYDPPPRPTYPTNNSSPDRVSSQLPWSPATPAGALRPSPPSSPSRVEEIPTCSTSPRLARSCQDCRSRRQYFLVKHDYDYHRVCAYACVSLLSILYFDRGYNSLCPTPRASRDATFMQANKADG